MDLRAEFERVIAEMEWEELVQTIEEMIAANGWADPPNPPFQPPLYPPFPASHTYSSYAHLTDQSGQIYSPAAAYGHGQYGNIPVFKTSEATYQNLVPVGMLNGDLVYMVPTGESAPSVPAAAPLTTPKSNKRKCETREDGGPYIKKPPNAFMAFRKEQAPIVAAELPNSNSAQVNAVVGQRLKVLSKEEQAKYYEEAEMENLLHIMNHPDWSSRDNYGKKRKRVRRKAPTRPEGAGVSSRCDEHPACINITIA
uniref:HMG box domain-containing protein n=1 Tax=Monopterus albus TaxID=43700 RepID=A0A3Q3KKB9_MONAL